MSGVLWLSRESVRRSGGGDPSKAASLIEAALVTHAEGDSCQPLKPYLKIPGDTKDRRIIAMPAYLGTTFQTWGLKWIASSPSNPTQRGIERASAIIILNDVETGRPVAVMEGALISATRTAAVALIAAKYLSPARPRTLACIGNGLIGSTIAQSLLATYPSIDDVRLFDQRPETAQRLKATIEGANGIACLVCDSPKSSLSGADLIVTATTAKDGYLEGDWLQPGCLFLNVSLRDPKFSVVEGADKVVVDDWEQINRSNTIIHRMSQAGVLERGDIHAELHEVISGTVPGREHDDETIMFNPMGLSIEDIATAWGVYQEAVRLGLGVELDLYDESVVSD